MSRIRIRTARGASGRCLTGHRKPAQALREALGVDELPSLVGSPDQEDTEGPEPMAARPPPRRAGCRGITELVHPAVKPDPQLLAIPPLVSQTRSTFENLAAFYRVIVRDYFDEKVSKERSYHFVTNLFPDPAVAELLRNFRHEMRIA